MDKKDVIRQSSEINIFIVIINSKSNYSSISSLSSLLDYFIRLHSSKVIKIVIIGFIAKKRLKYIVVRGYCIWITGIFYFKLLNLVFDEL